MHIEMSLSPDGPDLLISNVHLEYNHPLDKERFLTFPKQRKLDEESSKSTSLPISYAQRF